MTHRVFSLRFVLYFPLQLLEGAEAHKAAQQPTTVGSNGEESTRRLCGSAYDGSGAVLAVGEGRGGESSLASIGGIVGEGG